MNKRLRPLVFVGVLVILLIGVTYYFNIQRQNLPVLSPADVNTELVDPSVRTGGAHKIADFKLLDQKGNTISQELVKDKIYVADFFFTTCTSICPIMTGQMKRVSDEFADDDEIMFLSFSVLPETDQPEVLEQYADKNGVDYDKWKMITGDKQEIYSLARKSYFTLKEAEVGKGDGGDSDFIHTNNFVLVDKQKRIRGYYDGTSISDVDRLIEDIKILKRH